MQCQKTSPEPLRVIMKRQQSTEPIFFDPVCLKAVTSNKIDSTVTYRFRTYYFCAPACRKAFEKNPDKYLELKIHRAKGLWDRYLDKMKKVAGHKIF